ncbi:di-trans,poly-cis-decaprenylcistransferase [Salinarimonas rosea]|uniref:di-trans,poly-cis-decaprenylcistransferase n=1 Tax=Salinarimonas rosea TaxID=552063 RepID=UPI0003F9B427|nr:di-trans,poly-cis-decaprenylcistransferase [Salinarimonas rosea]
MQSTLPGSDGLHVALIMDGNGRWATGRGLPRTAGHRAGVESIRRVCEAAPDLGVRALTLYAFSADNWRRPAEEVAFLMRLLRRYLEAEAARLADSGVRLVVIGRRDRLPEGLPEAIAAAEAATAAGTRLLLRIAIDYSARDAILAAAASAPRSREEMTGLLAGAAGDVDLLVRTSGEKRLSDFLLWECAYAELAFVDTPWPDFDGAALAACLDDFRRRDRRFGGLKAA